VLIQTNAFADGGISSITQVISGLRQHRPIIVTDRDSARVDEWRKSGIETHVVPQAAARGIMRDPIGIIRSYWRYARELRRLIKSSGTKIVHANETLAFQLAVWPARSADVRIIFNVRDTIDPARKPPLRRYRLLFAMADHVIYLSHDMANRWEGLALNAKRACSVIYSVVDRTKFVPTPLPSRDPAVVLLSGLIGAKKGQLEFIRHVAPTLAAHGISTWFAGDFDPSEDPYMAACAEAAAPLGDAVRFLGYRSDIPELMAKSTVVAVPSRHEGLVRAMIEAMSCSRPVVSFDVCSARELLESQSGGAGQVVNIGDYEGMTNAILEYCRNRDLASKAGKRGHQTASRLFARDEVVRGYEQVYKKLAMN
jgi:glycosyltransferase involved in cell wall biosynthesis